jgi:hypothetical protein
MLSRSWFRRGVVGRPAVPAILMACFAVLLGAPDPSAAEEANWTVLTVARNGNWGIASARTQGEAIAVALLRCQAMTADASDCGAEFVAFKRGLALALMCGDHHVIVTASDSEEADSSALDRLIALRSIYGSDFPACQHLLQIDSSGALTTFKARRIESGYSLAAPK